MYQAHFGLKKSLFESGIAHDAAIFFGPKQKLIVANFKVAWTTLDSVVVLSGPGGVGKTTLASVTAHATSTRLALGWINNAPATAAELLELLLVEFGFNAHRVGRIERLQMWRQFLGEMNATESRVFVIVERAEDLAPEVLRALASLTSADANGCRGANLVLLGQAGIEEHLTSPLLESLRQRIRLRQKLEPFTVRELQEYLRHQVAHAGGVFEKVFATETVAALHLYSGGIARVANNLCETALTLAATGQEHQLTPRLVAKVAVGLFGFEPAQAPIPKEPSTSARKPAPSTAGTAAAPAAPRTAVPVTPTRVNEVLSTPAHEFDGSATDIPEVPMADFPLLTDAVAAAATRRAFDIPDGPFVENAAAAQSIEDSSNSSAATPSGKADLDMLSAALASGGWADDDKPTAAAQPDPKPATPTDDLMSLFDFGHDGPIELLDESKTPRNDRARKVSGKS